MAVHLYSRLTALTEPAAEVHVKQRLKPRNSIVHGVNDKATNEGTRYLLPSSVIKQMAYRRLGAYQTKEEKLRGRRSRASSQKACSIVWC